MKRKTSDRGYGADHQRRRARWAPKVAAGWVVCWRCGRPIKPGAPWDLGHDDDDRRSYRGPEHANDCNRSAAARRGNLLRRARRVVESTGLRW